MSGFNRPFPIVGDLKLTDDGRDLVLIAGPAKVAQSIRVRAQIFKGSWRYDRQYGVPYFEDILAFGASVELVRRRFYDLLAETDGVLTVETINVRFDAAAEKILVDFTVIADTGEIVRDVLDFKLS